MQAVWGILWMKRLHFNSGRLALGLLTKLCHAISWILVMLGRRAISFFFFLNIERLYWSTAWSDKCHKMLNLRWVNLKFAGAEPWFLHLDSETLEGNVITNFWSRCDWALVLQEASIMKCCNSSARMCQIDGEILEVVGIVMGSEDFRSKVAFFTSFGKIETLFGKLWDFLKVSKYISCC